MMAIGSPFSFKISFFMPLFLGISQVRVILEWWCLNWVLGRKG